VSDASTFIGDNIKQAREARKWRQRDLAEAMGVADLTVSRWERGVSPPSIRRLHSIAEALGTTTEALLSRNGVAA
jgi:transcriptional regulator with XRE-family HTH domain